MAKIGLLTAMAGISGLLTTTQVAAANGLADQIGLTAAGVVGLGWLAFLAVLAFAIILPLIRDQAAASGLELKERWATS